MSDLIAAILSLILLSPSIAVLSVLMARAARRFCRSDDRVNGDRRKASPPVRPGTCRGSLLASPFPIYRRGEIRPHTENSCVT